MVSIEVLEKALDKATQKGAFSFQDVQVISEHLNNLKLEVSKLQMIKEDYYKSDAMNKTSECDKAEKPSTTKK